MFRPLKRRAAALAVVLSMSLAGIVLVMAGPAQAANLLTNPGFETGTLSGWSCSGGLGSVVTSPVHSGSYALAGAASDSDFAQCTQTVTVQPNTAYTLSAWVRGNYVYLGVTGGVQTWTPSAASYTQLTTSFTTGAAQTSAQIYVHGWYGQGTYHADDMSLDGPGGGSGGDTQAPTAPGNLRSTGKTSSSVSLAWDASSDNVGVSAYDVYNGATKAATVTGTTATVSGLAASTGYSFTVKARDAAGNTSSASNAVNVTTDAASGGGGGGGAQVYEAENATISQGTVASDHAGFSGTGFVDYDNVVGSYVEWTVNAPTAGAYYIRFRFANETSTNRPMDITVGGSLAVNELGFRHTASWSGWESVTANVTLAAGANRIRATATTSNGGPNVDWLEVTPATFKHPGVLVSRAQLDFVRAKVAAGAEPWKSAYAEMRASSYASLSWTPKPRQIVECGPSSNPNYGCSDERNDAIAAYTHALSWYITGDSRYADKAIEIMDAWSATIQDHTNSNARLQTGWAGASFSRAGEIIRHTYSGWSSTGVNRFATMLRTVYLPELINGAPNQNGNWELIMTDATIGISVFLDDRVSFVKALNLWSGRVPAYVYLTGDGSLPKPPPGSTYDTSTEIINHWQGQSTFVDGLAQETCRDFGHTGWGFDAAIHVAETARHQGLDLYAEAKDRLTKALEFHANYDLGATVPSWLCGGSLKLGIGPTLEVGFNHYHNRLGISLPKTQQLIETKLRPTGANYFLAWETLTHADNP